MKKSKVKMTGAMEAKGHKPSEPQKCDSPMSIQKALSDHNMKRQKELTSSSYKKKGSR